MSQRELILNLGGEGEVPDIINQQGPWVLNPNWRSSRDAKTFAELVAEEHVFVICPNSPLPFPDNSVDVVYTNSVPVDIRSLLGPGLQSAEIRRILKSGGTWIRDGALAWTKP